MNQKDYGNYPFHTNKESPSTSSVIIEEQEAPPIVTTFEEQTSTISLNNADEFNQEDFADFDGNTVFVQYDAPNFKEAELLTTSLDPSNMHEFHQKHGMDDCVSMSTPMATERLDADLQGTPTDQMTYCRMIGGLMYLTASWPDIAFATFVCARYQACPTDSIFKLIAYSDANHARCKDDCKSTSGGLQFLGEKSMSWSSKKQDCTAMSTAEAEYVSLFAIVGVLWGSVGYCSWSKGMAKTMGSGGFGFGFGGKGEKDGRLKMGN
nr:hypothetical protein [Tanacetum cinerariifolium]